MLVYCFEGTKECNNTDELNRILQMRSKNGSNEFELRTVEQYPFVTILIKDNFACVHFFRNQSDCGHFAYQENSTYDEDGYTIFNMGSVDSETEISNQLLIPVEMAYIVARDFFLYHKMSKEISWFEL